MTRRIRSLALGLALAFAATGCNSSSGDESIASRMSDVGGDQQQAQVTATLPDPLRVQVLDVSDDPVENITVNWSTNATGATITNVSRTDADGIAEATFKLGVDVGVQTARAEIRGLDIDPVTFSATALAPPDDGDGGGGGGDL